MDLLRRGAALSLVFVAACSSTSRTPRSSFDAGGELSNDVFVHLDLPALPKVERLDAAQHAAAVIVLGMRRIEDACGTYIDLRLFPEVHLGAREVLEARDEEDDQLTELRALLYVPNATSACGEPRVSSVETNSVSVGDRIVVVLGARPSIAKETPTWKKVPRVVALAPTTALPLIAAALPKAVLEGESEQFIPVSRMPAVGTPASLQLLGGKPRFEVIGEEISDRALGVVWQRDLAPRPMSFEEAVFYCESQRTGGHDDWRLPTVIEMHGLFSPSLSSVIDPKLFGSPPNTLLWTRTDDDGPWVGSPGEGIVISTHYDDPSPYGNYHVRCVRPGDTLATELRDRFGEQDGVLLDTATGLSWYLQPNAPPLTLDVAKRYCEQGTFGGFNDWELPSPEAAFSLMSECPSALQNWEGKPDEVWTSMIDPQSKVGGTFRVCDLYRSVPLAAVFEKDGIDPKNPPARTMCVRATRRESPPDPKTCLMGSELKKIGSYSICEEKGVRHGPFRSSWPHGSLFETAFYEHGVRHGMSVMYHELGGLYSGADYVQGKLHGEVWSKRPTGTLLFKGAHTHGLPSGRWTFYDSKGREVEHIDMVQGRPESGQYLRYADTGEKLLEGETLGGWPHGITRTFDLKTGKTYAETAYSAGWLEGPVKTFAAGQGGTTGQNHRGEREGVWVGKNAAGQVVYRQSFHQGKLDGLQETFASDGKLLESRRFRDGHPVGVWEVKNSDGNIVQRGKLDEEGTGTITWNQPDGSVDREERYVRGKREGTWMEYHSPTQPKSKEEYRDDRLVSRIRFSENGQIAERENYLDGKKHGEAERYDSTGRLVWRGSYVKGLREGNWFFTTITGHRFEVLFEKGKAVRVLDPKDARQ